jgi:hypothetical protein
LVYPKSKNRQQKIGEKFADRQRKPEQEEKCSGEKMRISAGKIASIVFCAANGQKYKCLLGTPQAPKSAEQIKR